MNKSDLSIADEQWWFWLGLITSHVVHSQNVECVIWKIYVKIKFKHDVFGCGIEQPYSLSVVQKKIFKK